MKDKKNIVLCGYTRTAHNTIIELSRKEYSHFNCVLITGRTVENLKGIQHIKGDFSSLGVLKKHINLIKNAKSVVVFSEFYENDSEKDVDMRTALTVFNLKNIEKDIHVIAEIINEGNSKILSEQIGCDEIIFKNTIDANLITSCILHPNVSSIIYELVNLEGKSIGETNLSKLQLERGTTFKDLKFFGLENDLTFLGYISPERETILSPDNDTLLTEEMRILFLE